MCRFSRLFSAISILVSLVLVSPAQWSNRYPKVDGFNHHVYLEGFELPILTSGPMDPAPSPDGGSLAFSSRGWIWLLDLKTSVARRLTDGRDMDFRPAWSPDGRKLAFVRDNDHETSIVVREVMGGDEIVIDSPAIELDPAFSADGRSLYYSSGEAGDLDIWRYDFDSAVKVQVTSAKGIEVRPQPHPDGNRLIYLAKTRGMPDQILMADLGGDVQTSTVLHSASIVSMSHPALSADGTMLAYNWPTEDDWELYVSDLDSPEQPIRLVGEGLPLAPAWSTDGRELYFSQANSDEQMTLKKVSAHGGAVRDVPIHSWVWGQPTGTLRISSRMTRAEGLVPVRLSVIDGQGHPVIPDRTASHFDMQNGRVFFYTPGLVELQVPAGEVTVAAVQGLTTIEASSRTRVQPGAVTDVTIELESFWDAREQGWTSGEHHFHLNYGGPYDLSPEDLVLKMRGENLDLATPLLANLHNRFGDQDLWRWRRGERPLIRFGQEVRSHFLGHLGLIEIDELFWPWAWGPGYQVYGRDDRTNGEVFDFAHRQGGLAYYVHPYSRGEPFSEEGMERVPVEFVADGVLGDMDTLEVVCLWSAELATSELWYRLLNLGRQVMPSAGTDVMTDYYRTMAVGTTRVYAQTGEAVNWPSYIAALKEGRSFVTNGPILLFALAGKGPGETVAAVNSEAEWTVDLRSAGSVETLEILINGEVVSRHAGLSKAGEQRYSGTIQLPEGGWVAARAIGGETAWPAMDSYPFAHTAPIWIGHIGSTAVEPRRLAAGELLALLEVSRKRLQEAYGDSPIPRLLERFEAARLVLQRQSR